MSENVRSTIRWRKSSYSGGDSGQCVELANFDNSVGVRDSTDPEGPVLQATRRAIAGLVSRIKTGELDR